MSWQQCFICLLVPLEIELAQSKLRPFCEFWLNHFICVSFISYFLVLCFKCWRFLPLGFFLHIQYKVWSLYFCALLQSLLTICCRKKSSHLLKLVRSTRPSLRNVRTWLTWPSSMMPLSSTTWRCATSPSWSTPVSFHLFWKITLHLSIYFHCWIDKNLSTKLECFDLVCHFLTWHNFDFNVFSQTLVSSVLWSTLTNAIPSTLQ